MSQDKKTKQSGGQPAPLWTLTGHGRPVTRREMLAAGVIPFAGSLIAPQWLSLLMSSGAQAQTQSSSCATASTARTMIPFVSVNLAGGAALASNFVPTDLAGQFLPSYDVMGLGMQANLPIVREFGNVPFAGSMQAGGPLISQFLQGVRGAGGAAVNKTAFVGVCTKSRDDTSENQSAVEGMISRTGLTGSLLPNLGSRSTRTGNNNAPAIVAPPAPLIVSNLSSLSQSLGYAAALGRTLSANQKGSLAKLINKLSSAQARKFASVRSGDEIRQVVECAGLKNVELNANGASGVDPRADAAVGTQLNQIWGINAQTGGNNSGLIQASMVYNALKGQAGAATLELGGYDYHDNSRATGDRKDLEAGTLVGRILASADALQSPVFIYVTSDGAVSSPRSNSANAPWSSDRGNAGAAYMLLYDPAGRRPTRSNQIGGFTRGQEADGSFITGNNPGLAGAAVVANYLQANGRLNTFDTVAPQTISASDLDKVLRFD